MKPRHNAPPSRPGMTLAVIGPCVPDGELHSPWFDVQGRMSGLCVSLNIGVGEPGATCRV